uniref:Serine/threonine-protein phosphatase PGAM5, mitochondrial n=1 Tax=Parastrongyloides trichosuri TaxID=131310 RepID=A0A0N5A4Z5_PARTI
MFKKVVGLVVPSAALAGAICTNDGGFKEAFAKEKKMVKYEQLEREKYFPIEKKWDSNWDLRSSESLIKSKQYINATDEEKEDMLKSVTPKATRNIFLIRHGQYHLKSKDKYLTDLGKKQAVLLGKRLSQNGVHFDKVIYSTMNRATETAQIMMNEMKQIESSCDSMLEEGAPYPPEPAVGHWRPLAQEFYEDGARIEAAFRKYIHRAEPKQENDSYELIVCHANVIRYFICRALQLPPEAWLRMSLGNTSITWLVIRPNGNVSIRCIGDIGHLDKDTVTFT